MDYKKFCTKLAQKIEDCKKYVKQDFQCPVKYPKIPPRLNSFNLNQNISEDWIKIYTNLKMKILKDYIGILCGNRGTGKSQMGTCLIKFCCNMGKTAVYENFMDILFSIKESSVNRKYYIYPFFLVIDAFEIRHETDYEDCYINYIIDKRYSYKKSTLIITNDEKNNLPKVLGPSIVDRIIETGGIVEANWKSFRK